MQHFGVLRGMYREMSGIYLGLCRLKYYLGTGFEGLALKVMSEKIGRNVDLHRTFGYFKNLYIGQERYGEKQRSIPLEIALSSKRAIFRDM